jgi:ubiquinone/menaquinone biosynthesis C-methylase UbiE
MAQGRGGTERSLRMSAPTTEQATDVAQSDSSANAKGHRWFAAIYDKQMRSMERGFMAEMRRQVLGDLKGDVLEIGAGTGANFEYYPDAARVTALEPDPFMLKRAETKLAALGRTNIAVQRLPAERLPFDDASFDTVVSTLVLCTADDVPRSLAEIRRVLRTGGELRFVEHVRAVGFAGRTQDFIKPVWRYFGAGCNPNRRTEDALRTAGFDVRITERRKIMGFAPLIRGVATPTVRA